MYNAYGLEYNEINYEYHENTKLSNIMISVSYNLISDAVVSQRFPGHPQFGLCDCLVTQPRIVLVYPLLALLMLVIALS